jgi:hypothetical protein
VDEACDWLATSPGLDAVAAKLRALRLAQRELSHVVELLRLHALLALGEVGAEPTVIRVGPDEEPF